MRAWEQIAQILSESSVAPSQHCKYSIPRRKLSKIAQFFASSRKDTIWVPRRMVAAASSDQQQTRHYRLPLGKIAHAAFAL